MKFQPGQSGNPGGKTKLRILTEDLRKVVAQNPDRVRKISEHVLTEAENGDLAYIQFLYDRLDGKAAQTVDINNTVTVSPSERLSALLRRGGNIVDVEPLQLEAEAVDK